MLGGAGVTVASVGRANLLESARTDLALTAKTAALFVDPALHQRVEARGITDKATYDRALAGLVRFQSANRHLRYVYTLAETGEGKMHFVLDTAPAGDADGDGVQDKSFPGDAYDEASPVVHQVIDTRTAMSDKEPYSDRWGTFLSGYAPLFDAKGRVIGLVGVDLEARKLIAQMREVEQAGTFSLFLAAMVSALAGLAVFVFRAQSEAKVARLNEQVNRAQTEAVELQLEIEGRDRLIGDLNRQRRIFIEELADQTQEAIGKFLSAMESWKSKMAANGCALSSEVAMSALELRQRIDDAKDLATVDSGRVRMEIISTPVGDEVRHAIRDVWKNLGKEIPVALDLHSELEESTMLPALRFRQVVRTLVTALYQHHGETVRVAGTVEKDAKVSWLVLQISTEKAAWYESNHDFAPSSVPISVASRLVPLMGGVITALTEDKVAGWEIRMPIGSSAAEAA